MNGYSVTAQYYDPLMSALHADVDRRIAAALANMDVTAGPVVDIGAGTGLSTALVASTLPAAEILAVEPDAAMRPALMTRVWANAALRARVSILPFDVFSAPLPERIAGAVLSASLVHFAPPDRARLWSLLAERLAPEGRIIVEVQFPAAEDMPETDMAQVQLGRVVYRASATAERLASDRQRWTMKYRVSLEGREIACETTSYECWTISADRVLAEAGAAGLGGRITDDLVILQHRLRPG